MGVPRIYVKDNAEDPEIVFESAEGPEIVFESDELCHPARFEPLFGVSFETIEHRTCFQPAPQMGVPRIYMAANAGARFGLSDAVKKVFRVAWVGGDDPTKGVAYLWLTDKDKEALGDAVLTERVDAPPGDEVGYLLKKRLSPGAFPRHPNTPGPDIKKTVTEHAKYSIRQLPAFINLQGNQ